jgi:hypothetical protein
MVIRYVPSVEVVLFNVIVLTGTDLAGPNLL